MTLLAEQGLTEVVGFIEVRDPDGQLPIPKPNMG
jgi:hypothetical protein